MTASSSTPSSVDPGARPDVEVRYSSRRRKTASAHLSAGRIVVVLPSRVSRAEADRVTERLVAGILRKNAHLVSTDAELADRAARLADRYLGGVRPRSIRWSSRQSRSWGTCSTSTGDIRLAGRLRLAPEWVVDSVIVHELAHLIEPSHNSRFWQLAGRFERSPEAKVFLDGYGLGLRVAAPATAVAPVPTTSSPAET